MRILIVEDEPTLGPQLKATLEGAGYAVGLRLPWSPDLRLDVSGARPAGSHRAADGRSTQYWARISTTF